MGTRVDVTITNPSDVWVGHPDPDVDVALIDIGGTIIQLLDKIFYKSIPVGQMPAYGDGVFMDAVEDVTFIGYPDGRQDPVHLTPIARRGITATPLELNFAGKPAFLIGGSVFGGSSGSPVFLLNHAFYRSGPTNVAAGNRCVLIGIVASTALRNRALPLVVGTGPHVKIAQELNLGVVYNWHALNQVVEEFRHNPPSARPSTLDPSASES